MYNLAQKIYQGLASERKPLFDFVAQFSMKRDREAYLYYGRTIAQHREKQRHYDP